MWDCLSGELLRSFPSDAATSPDVKAGVKTSSDPLGKSDWPLLKWSHDDAYVARMTTGEQGVLYVYETPSMGLINKKSIKVWFRSDVD